MLLGYFLLTLALLSVGLALWQCGAAMQFPFIESQKMISSPQRATHRGGSERAESSTAGGTVLQGRLSPVSISILRPVKGADSKTEECLESWFREADGESIEMLFGVASADDPVCRVVRDLIGRHPGVRAELHVCSPILGPNAKVSSLCYLSRRATGEIVAVADQDVFIKPGFLEAALEPLNDSGVGLVNCFYLQANPANLAMRLEAVAVNADFWSQVLQGNSLKPMDFALGAVMITRAAELARIGGFESLLDYLADDYQLGNRVARNGRRVAMARAAVECRSDEQSAAEVWKHQLRWGRTIRVCQPAPYFFSILSNATLWPLLAWFVGAPGGTKVLAGALIVRLVTAKLNYIKLTRDVRSLTPLLAPIKDLFQVLIWALSFTGNEIEWRGQRFRVDAGGKLTPLA